MKGISLTAIVAVVILTVSLLMGLSFWGISDEKTPDESSSEPIEMMRQIKAERYIMREYEGRLAVFAEDGSLVKIYETNLSLLPEYDQKLLKNGIAIVGEEELRARIEDYTS